MDDKGYQGPNESLQVIHPKKVYQIFPLSASEDETNRKISSDRVVVELFLGGCAHYGNFLSTSGNGMKLLTIILLKLLLHSRISVAGK